MSNHSKKEGKGSGLHQLLYKTKTKATAHQPKVSA